jgi:hypothetical protein
MYSRFGIFSFILLISGISSVLSGKFVYDCEHKRIKTLEEKIAYLNIELLKCKHELKTLEETNSFRESYLQLEKCMKRIENKDNRNLKLKNKDNISDSDSFENLNQLDDKSVDKSSSEDSSKSKIEPEFESDDRKFNPLTNPSNDP